MGMTTEIKKMNNNGLYRMNAEGWYDIEYISDNLTGKSSLKNDCLGIFSDTSLNNNERRINDDPTSTTSTSSYIDIEEQVQFISTNNQTLNNKNYKINFDQHNIVNNNRTMYAKKRCFQDALLNRESLNSHSNAAAHNDYYHHIAGGAVAIEGGGGVYSATIAIK